MDDNIGGQFRRYVANFRAWNIRSHRHFLFLWNGKFVHRSGIHDSSSSDILLAHLLASPRTNDNGFIFLFGINNL